MVETFCTSQSAFYILYKNARRNYTLGVRHRKPGPEEALMDSTEMKEARLQEEALKKKLAEVNKLAAEVNKLAAELKKKEAALKKLQAAGTILAETPGLPENAGAMLENAVKELSGLVSKNADVEQEAIRADQ